MKWLLIIVFVGSVHADQYHDSEKFKAMTMACINGENPALCLRELNYKDKLAHKQSASSQKNTEARSSQQDTGNITTTNGTTVFDVNECVGEVVNGKCDAPILSNKAAHKKCHGKMIDSRCIGPMF